MRAARDSFLNPVLSLGLCVAAGALFAWLRTPLPWMIGPLLVMAMCFLDGAPRYVAGVMASILISLALAALAGTALAWFSGLPVPSLILATAPGGIAEMSMTAKVLQLGVPLVTAAHVTRVIVLVTTTGPIYRIALRLARRAPAR